MSNPTDDDPAAYWDWRRSSARSIFDRVVDENLLHLEDAVSRLNKGSYGFEDFADDLRAAWSRGSRDMVDLGRAMYGLTPRPDDVASVTATLEQGSQTSGPIFFTCKARHPIELEIKHLHRISEGEVEGTSFLGSSDESPGESGDERPDHFRFDPPRIPGDYTPTQVVLKLVGINQYDGNPNQPSSTLPTGRYIGFIGGKVPKVGRGRTTEARQGPSFETDNRGNRVTLDAHGAPRPAEDFDVIAVLLLYVVEPHASLTVES